MGYELEFYQVHRKPKAQLKDLYSQLINNIYFYHQMISLLIPTINHIFNQSYINEQISNNIKNQALEVIVSQRNTITQLYKQLKGTGQHVGCVYIIQVEENKYSMKYSEHQIYIENYTYYLNAYRPLYLFEQIRDFITEHNPNCVKRLKPKDNPNIVYMNIYNFIEFEDLIEKIIFNTALMDPDAKDISYENHYVPNYVSIISYDMKFIPFYHASNYYLRQIGYLNDDMRLFQNAVINMEQKLLGYCLYDTSNVYTFNPITITNQIKGFIQDLKNFREYDPAYKGYIFVEPSIEHNTLKLVKAIVQEINETEPYIFMDNPNNNVDVFGNEIFEHIPL